MRKIIGILLIYLISGVNANAFFSTAIFKKGKELDFNKFFNFDITKYSYEDHEKIIGSDFEKWDGNPDNKNKFEIDFKKINILVDGDKQSLKLSKFKENIHLHLQFESNSCERAENKIPTKFINKNNYREHVSDFGFLKMRSIYFSYDNKNSRVTFSCLQIESSEKNPTVTLNITPKNEKHFPQILPIKPITCRLDEAKTNLDHEWFKMKANSYINLYILDDQKVLLNPRKLVAGEIQTFDEENIHVIQKYKNESKVKMTVYTEYIIDRINGSFKYKKKDFDPDIYAKPRYGIKDGIVVVDYVGMCEKKTQQKKF
tara:strand:- start:54 stop:998 length:945 start_codon:yes stop_codon:yes gene_type:complete